MSNDQWNNGQNNQWVPQPGAQGGTPQPQEWGQPQHNANEWGQQSSAGAWDQQATQSEGEWGQQASQSANEWGQQAQQPAGEWAQQPASQGSAQEWGQQVQPSANDWAQQGQSANDWAQQGQPAQQDQMQQQGWDQQAQQGWGQQQWQGGMAPMPMAQPSGGGIFDFSFRQFSLPKSASVIWIIILACLVFEWLFGFINIVLSYDPDALSIVQTLLGGVAGIAVKALVVRVLLEIGIAAVKLVEQTKKDEIEGPQA